MTFVMTIGPAATVRTAACPGSRTMTMTMTMTMNYMRMYMSADVYLYEGPTRRGSLELLPVLRLITVLLNTILQRSARRGSLELLLAPELTTVLLNTILLNSRRRQAQASREEAQQHSSVSAGRCTSSPARRTAPTG
mgnify:CR=1 FL=1